MQTSAVNTTFEIIDNRFVTILPTAGFGRAELMKDPYYMPENDPEMRKAISREI